MPLTDNTPDTQVREVLAHGGGDEAFLMSMSESMGTFEQLLETCTGVLLHLSSGNIEDDTPFHVQRRHCTWIRP
jgi:hypothetical protein